MKIWKEVVLYDFNACWPAREWFRSKDISTYQAWKTCPNAEWLFWLAPLIGIDKRLVVRAACDCIEPELVHVTDAGIQTALRLILKEFRGWTNKKVSAKTIRDLYWSLSFIAHARLDNGEYVHSVGNAADIINA